MVSFAGITTLDDVAGRSEAELLALHGVGLRGGGAEPGDDFVPWSPSVRILFQVAKAGVEHGLLSQAVCPNPSQGQA